MNPLVLLGLPASSTPLHSNLTTPATKPHVEPPPLFPPAAMPDKVLLATLAINILFLATGALELGFCLVVQGLLGQEPVDGREAVRHLLYREFPLDAGIANASIILATFVFTLVGLASKGRSVLKLSGYLIAFCAIFTLCLGVVLWVMTLRVKETFYPTYLDQDPSVQSAIQTSFGCCGYVNASTPAFITDSTCPSPAAAALLRGCATSISSFANIALDVIFTALFGMVGVDALFILSIAALLKVRKERERYRHIDDKSGYQQF
ncbi:tetraspanin [Cordyceps militaris CM01]|uniref:Tetraspanin n=1 Tax=Cordyceps militaris (strain CM01) TaxID=983644 RepID=G3J9U8_CORMM|nr:tetraspanin [Cordyceps militaris CM01]EGX95021.1 tetraspanin [Cordyceps militaris CM01]